jgi:UDP-3-O-[3-hydroxymyristoyl] glucosamine N-acyltransferase
MTKTIGFDLEKGLPFQDLSLKEISRFMNAELRGNDKQVEYMVRLKAKRPQQQNFLTYVGSDGFWEMFANSEKESAIVSRSLADKYGTPEGKSIIVVDEPAEQAYFVLHEYLAEHGFFPLLKAERGTGVEIHPAATVYDNVILGNNVQIDANVVLYPNTYIGDNSIIKAGSIIGGHGGEYKMLKGMRRRVTHTGGVYLGKNVEVGSLNCIDRDLSGNFTKLHDHVKTDNLAQIAHNVSIGEGSTISSHTEISGSVVIGKGIWYGPKSCCTNEITIGDYAYITLGSTIIKDIPAYAFMIGNPPRQMAWMCQCHRTKLNFGEDMMATCGNCGRSYKLIDEEVHLVADPNVPAIEKA